MISREIRQIAVRLAVLKDHQSRHGQHGNDVLQKDIERDPEELAMREAAEDICECRDDEDRDQIFDFEPEKPDAGSEISGNRCGFERHIESSLSSPLQYRC